MEGSEVDNDSNNRCHDQQEPCRDGTFLPGGHLPLVFSKVISLLKAGLFVRYFIFTLHLRFLVKRLEKPGESHCDWHTRIKKMKCCSITDRKAMLRLFYTNTPKVMKDFGCQMKWCLVCRYPCRNAESICCLVNYRHAAANVTASLHLPLPLFISAFTPLSTKTCLIIHTVIGQFCGLL